SIKLRKCSSKIITSILSFISGRLATKSNQIKQLIRNGRSASLQRTFKKSFTSFSHSTRNKTRDGLIRVRNIRALNGRFNTSITHAYSIVIESLRSSRSSYFATFRHQLTILSKTDALDEEKWLNMLGTFVKDWFRYESHFVHGRDSLVDILKERGLLSESDAVQPLIGKKS